jgi:hypothetical protein
LILWLTGVSTVAIGQQPDQPKADSDRVRLEVKYRLIAAEKLGTCIGEMRPGSKVLLLAAPSPWDPVLDGSITTNLVGLRIGLGSKAVLVGVTRPSIAPELMSQPLEKWFTVEVLRDAVSPYAGKFDLLVTVIGLPPQLDSAGLKSLGLPDAPVIAILSGSVYRLKAAIESGAVIAAVDYNRLAEYEAKPAPDGLSLKDFGKRFVLLTSESLQAESAAGRVVFAE